MMTTAELALATLAVLVVPGPTNTLMFLAGTEGSLTRALRLIPAEVAGYLAAVIPLMLIGSTLIAVMPGVQTAVTLIAAVWVAVLAVRLFRLPAPDQTRGTVTARLVFVTTLLNPKALIFGLVLLPAPGAALGNLGLFTALVILVAAGWAAAGVALRHGTAPVPLLRRAAAVWLAVVSATLVLRGFGV
jgi:threonine/homoserine/homoserine lactone efflux protein